MSTPETLTEGAPASKLAPWENPADKQQPDNQPKLRLMNSLTRQKEDFVTMDGSNRILWYMCGPTVYAESHMGHARTYLGFDILSRILQHYFGYDVTLIMNITDIDDKIIERANERGMTHSELSRKYEAEFHRDMRDMNVRPPTLLTRVTEYMPQITDYIKKIVDNGLAYESNGSVYFDVQAFEAKPNMHYCKLAPEQIENAQLLAEGEGKLTQDFFSDKRSPRDFALWKKSKANEPQWESPWGPGRPGWHIECSVMASDVLEKHGATRMDIHSGGVDLKFPHHDNEMAQAEAHCGETQWVNYFVHSGHLHIQGLKMSKSLKNFITIQQALEINSARQIRLLFLRHKYNAPMDYGDNTMQHAMAMDRHFVEFFLNSKAALRQHSLDGPQAWNEAAYQLQHELGVAQHKVDTALRDDMDTPTALQALQELTSATNRYMATESAVVGLVVRNVASYVTRIFRIFGLMEDEPLGFSEGTGASAGANREQVLEPVLDALMNFRTQVRAQARNKDVTGVLQECDKFRDEILPALGIRLEDKDGGSVWKLEDPAELLRQREAERLRKEEEQGKKAAEAARKEAEKSVPPSEWFRQMHIDDTNEPLYSQFDELGVPTHDSKGEPLSKSQSKKVQKEFKNRQNKYEKYLKSKRLAS